MVRPAGFEPTTLGFGGRYSIQLSYGRITNTQYPISPKKQSKTSEIVSDRFIRRRTDEKKQSACVLRPACLIFERRQQKD